MVPLRALAQELVAVLLAAELAAELVAARLAAELGAARLAAEAGTAPVCPAHRDAGTPAPLGGGVPSPEVLPASRQ